MLITVGVLFALHQAGIIDFSRSWPLILIVVGLMKLFERAVTPQQIPSGPMQPPPPEERPQ